MLKSLKWLIWTVLFLVMMLGIDQFFVQVPPVHPAHASVASFYQDFRHRLVNMMLGKQQPQAVVKKPAAPKPKSPKSIEAVIDQQKQKSDKPSEKVSQRYVYSDADGQLQFAESLDDVPQQFRAQAQPMSR